MATTLAQTHDTFIFDCDGVIWRGTEQIPGAAETIATLRHLGKRIMFVTNAASLSRPELRAKLEGLGIPAHDNEMVTAAYAVALHLKTAHPEVKKCFVMGGPVVIKELEAVGVRVVGGGVSADGRGTVQHAGETVSEHEFAALRDDPDVGAVIVSSDYALNFSQICRASLYLQQRPRMPFLTSSNDSFDQLNGRRFPGPTHIAAHAIAASSLVEPVVTGKPSMALAQHLIKEHGLDPARTAMIGDRLDSDIEFGNGAGFTSVLVQTGVTSPAMLASKAAGCVDDQKNPRAQSWWPDVQLKSVADVLSHPARQTGAWECGGPRPWMEGTEHGGGGGGQVSVHAPLTLTPRSMGWMSRM